MAGGSRQAASSSWAKTIHDGLVREVLEETGLVVEPDYLTGVYKNMRHGIVALDRRRSESTTASRSCPARDGRQARGADGPRGHGRRLPRHCSVAAWRGTSNRLVASNPSRRRLRRATGGRRCGETDADANQGARLPGRGAQASAPSPTLSAARGDRSRAKASRRACDGHGHASSGPALAQPCARRAEHARGDPCRVLG